MTIVSDDPAALLGGKLWAWTGRDATEWTFEGSAGNQRIQRITDQGGRGHHFLNYTHPQWRPGYQSGFSIAAAEPGGPYTTSEPICGVYQHSLGATALDGNVFFQRSSLNAATFFYLAVAFANLRTVGISPLFGSDGVHNVLLDQETDTLSMTLDGTRIPLTQAGEVPKGAVIVEVWRWGTGSRLNARINGKQSTLETSASAPFNVSGFGYDGTAPWRDPIFEIIMVDGSTGGTLKRRVKDWLGERWGIPTLQTGGTA